jgi:hypothetical protein
MFQDLISCRSMGIMAIEFAEKRTPLCEINPMVRDCAHAQ